MKSLQAERESPKGRKILQFSSFLDGKGLIRAKGRKSKSHFDFNAKHPLLLHRKDQRVELFLRNGHKDNQHEGREHVRNMVQQKMWFLGVRNALRSIKVCYLQKNQSAKDNTRDGRSTRRPVRCFKSRLQKFELAITLWRMREETRTDDAVCSHAYLWERCISKWYPSWTQIVVSMQPCELLGEKPNQAQSSATTGQTLWELNENLHSMLRHWTEEGSKNT